MPGCLPRAGAACSNRPTQGLHVSFFVFEEAKPKPEGEGTGGGSAGRDTLGIGRDSRDVGEGEVAKTNNLAYLGIP